jgi:flagellar assembly protein FliH
MVVEAAREAHEEEERLRVQKEAFDRAYNTGFAKGLEEGVAKGFSEGMAKGESSGKAVKEEEIAEYTRLTHLLSRLSSDLKDWVEKISFEAETDLLKISVAIAGKIIRREIAENHEVISGFVAEGLKNIAPADSVRVRIHPQDSEFLTGKNPELMQAISGIESLRFEIDPTLLPGDCIVESRERSVDGRLESQLAIMEKALLPKKGHPEEKGEAREQ